MHVVCIYKKTHNFWQFKHFFFQFIIFSAIIALCLAYPADDTKSKDPALPKTYIIDDENAPQDDLASAESAQWGGGWGGRGWGGGRWGGGGWGGGWGGGRGWGGGGWGGGGWGGGGWGGGGWGNKQVLFC